VKPLSKELRNKFERTIEDAREVAEEAAKIALEQLGVGEASPYSYLSEDERALRRRLRAHGRNLGDIRDSKTETQEIDRLVEEIAYEHWHRMLFARFLAENDLLMYYEDNDIENAVPVTLSECDELAEELGLKNGWEMAAKLATKMLPQIFKINSPIFEIQFSPEYQRKLENVVSSISKEVFLATDSLGWVYQYWQSRQKETINKSGVKIGSQELPAVTQLFTEDYMVQFLLDNTIGAWWATHLLSNEFVKKARTEQELRTSAAFSNVQLDYLRFVKDENGQWEVGSKSGNNWPDDLTSFKMIDPCCGSGHFLVAAFLMLVPMRSKLEGISIDKAIDSVLSENIHGLEIDQRCIEIAAFSLAFTAWKYPGSTGFRVLPELNLACSGLPLNTKMKNWTKLAGENQTLKYIMESLYNKFSDAPILGSLIDFSDNFEEQNLFHNDWEKARRILTSEQFNSYDYEKNEFEISAKGVSQAANLLLQKYDLVATNYPFIGIRKQNAILKKYCEDRHKEAKHDLSTCLIERCSKLLKTNGTMAFVSPHNWYFLGAYRAFRENLLKEKRWNMIALLGSRSFQTPMYDFGITLTIFSNDNKFDDNLISGITVEDYNTPDEKANALKNDQISVINQLHQLKNPDQRVTLEVRSEIPLLQENGTCLTGAMNGDSPKFIRKYWEFDICPEKWVFLQSTVTTNTFYSGRDQLIYYDVENGHLREDPYIRREKLHNSDERGKLLWGKNGVMVHRMGKLPVTLYTGDVFDQNGAVIVPNKEISVAALWCYLSSEEFNKEVRKLDTKVGVTPATLAKVPFEVIKWESIAIEKYPTGLPKPYTNDPTQWIFHGHPCKTIEWDNNDKKIIKRMNYKDKTVLHISISRLLGFRWPSELDSEMELSDEAKALVEECGGLLSYADKDGIVCIPSVRGEAPASERLLNLLAAAYKDEDINTILPQLLADADNKGKNLESWLRDKFFIQHCTLFANAPFIWQIWDGLKDGFSALVNYHKLDRKNLETLIYTYLGDWISKQKSAMVEGIEGAEEKLNAAISLKKKLELILEGEAPYDIFVRWKPLNKQPLGWEPDLNDGVRINIRPFMSVGDVGKKGAGVLRDKPNIKWTKDRGKDTENSPWYHLFGGDRINDHHVTLEEKKKAREEMR